jgi:hypothetical protein
MSIKHTFKYLRSVSGKVEERVETRNLTRSQAIKFNCLDCSGGVVAEVRECIIKTCPLWVFRPYQNAILDFSPIAGIEIEDEQA